MKRKLSMVCLVMCAASWFVFSTSARAQSQRYVAALGDSLTDEYFEQDLPTPDYDIPQYDYAKSWFELIVTSGKADGGELAKDAGLTDDTWGEPRRTGYEYNFARWGATLAGLPGQVSSLASAWPPDGLTPNNYFVGACIGANDFSPSTAWYAGLYAGTLDFEADVQPSLDTLISGVANQLDIAVANNINVVLANVPDYGIAPFTYNNSPGAGYTDGSQRENVDFAVNYMNTQLAALASERGLPLIDIYGLTKAVFGDNTDLANMDLFETKQLGGVDIYIRQPDMLDGDGEPQNPWAAWVHDGVHPHTTIQGVFANLFMEASNLRYGTSFELFSEEEILANAGLGSDYSGDTLFTDVGLGSQYSGYSDFITVPEPSAFLLGIIGVLALACLGRRRVGRRAG